MSLPRVTIVTPSYNQGAYLEETLRSVLDQDYPDIEYLVVDDGSTDGSYEIVERYADRLTWHTTQPNAGQVAAINAGFARATGELVGWLNSDDPLLPGAISAVVEEFQRNPGAYLVYGANVLIDEHGAELGPLAARPFDLRESIRTCQNYVAQPGSLFRREALELAGPLAVEGYYYFDFEFVLKLALHGEVKAIDRVLAGYRLHPESKSVAADVRKADDHVRVFDGYFARTDLPPEIRALEAEARSRSYLVAGEYLYKGLRLGPARRMLLRGLRLYPRHADGRTLSVLARTCLPAALVRRLRERRQGSAPPSAAT